MTGFRVRNLSVLRRISSSVGAVVALGSCGGGDGVTSPPPSPPSVVASVTVTPDAGALPVGGSLQLTATTRDAAGNALTGRAVTWSGDNPSVASVGVPSV